MQVLPLFICFWVCATAAWHAQISFHCDIGLAHTRWCWSFFLWVSTLTWIPPNSQRHASFFSHTHNCMLGISICGSIISQKLQQRDSQWLTFTWGRVVGAGGTRLDLFIMRLYASSSRKGQGPVDISAHYRNSQVKNVSFVATGGIRVAQLFQLFYSSLSSSSSTTHVLAHL